MSADWRKAAHILVVDDEEPIRRGLVRLLVAAGYKAAAAAGTTEALELSGREHFDLVVSDVMMPGESGFGLLRKLHERSPDTAVLLVTALDDPGVAELVAGGGASGYIVKPYTPSEILVNVATALGRRADLLEMQQDGERLREGINDRERRLSAALRRAVAGDDALRASQEETVDRLANAAEWRDSFTGRHLVTMSVYAGRLARLTGMDEGEADMLRIASKLHDIGKVGLPDAVLLKTGRYTDAERTIMQDHCRIGARMLAGSDSPLLWLAADVALMHHERWDGSGYPQRLAGPATALVARIAAVADVYDALRSERPYKPALSFEQSIDTMRAGRGTQFDPELVDVFLADLEARGDDRDVLERPDLPFPSGVC